MSPRKIGITRTLLEEGQYIQQEIATRLKISQKSVSRIKKMNEIGKVYQTQRRGKCGRKSKLSPRGVRKLMAEARRNRKSTSRELRTKLLDKGIDVSARTVRITLFEGGLKARRPRRKAKITPDMVKKRLD